MYLLFPYDVSIIKNEKSLQRAMEEIQRIKLDVLPNLKANDAHTQIQK